MKLIILFITIIITLCRNRGCDDSICDKKCSNQYLIVDGKTVVCHKGSCFPNNIGLCYCSYFDGNTFKVCNNVLYDKKGKHKRLK